MSNVYLHVNTRGVVYDQTYGRNKEMILNMKYILPKGEGSIMVSEDDLGSRYVTRLDKYNETIYKTIITNNKNYVSSIRGCDELISKDRYAKSAYRHIKNHLIIKHKVNIISKHKKPYTIELVIKEGVIDYFINVTIDEDMFDFKSMTELTKDVKKLNNLNVFNLIQYYKARTMTFVVDENFYNIIDTLGLVKSVKNA